MKDYYDILGIARGASKDDIKKAYRKLAHQYHPDKKGGDETKFKEINEAYQILSNDSKRAQYDQFGRVNDGFGANRGGWDFSSFRGFEDMDVGDIFETFFGGQAGREGKKRGRDIAIDIEIPFAESIFGSERRVLIRKRAICDTCSGTGKERNSKEITCSQCHGAGTIRDTRRSFFGSFTQVVECSLCHGHGKVPEKKCHTCHGEAVIPKSEEARIIIPPGIENGEVIRIAHKGEAMRNGDAGDLYIKVHVLSHPVFRRTKSDLIMKLEIPLSEALIGGNRKVEVLDGKIELKVPHGVTSGEVLKVKGKGVPHEDGSRGDLLAEVKVKMPSKISSKVKALVEELQKEGY